MSLHPEEMRCICGHTRAMHGEPSQIRRVCCGGAVGCTCRGFTSATAADAASPAVALSPHPNETLQMDVLRRYAEAAKGWGTDSNKTEDELLQRIWNLAHDVTKLLDFSAVLEQRAERAERDLEIQEGITLARVRSMAAAEARSEQLLKAAERVSLLHDAAEARVADLERALSESQEKCGIARESASLNAEDARVAEGRVAAITRELQTLLPVVEDGLAVVARRVLIGSEGRDIIAAREAVAAIRRVLAGVPQDKQEDKSTAETDQRSVSTEVSKRDRVQRHRLRRGDDAAYRRRRRDDRRRARRDHGPGPVGR